jgi:putative membrane protein
MFMKHSIAIALLLAAAGCDTDDNNRTDSGYRTTNERYPDSSTRSPESGTRTGTQTGAVSQDARTFVHEAYSGGLFEVQSSQLVLQMNPDPQIERIAQMMVQDHQRVNQELQSLTSRKGISLPQQLSPKHQQMLQRVRSASSNQVASQYHTIQVQAHQEAIALFEKASQTLQDQELRSFAQRTLPKLRQHLDHIQQARPSTSGTTTPQPQQPVRTPPDHEEHEMPDMDDEPGGVEP